MLFAIVSFIYGPVMMHFLTTFQENMTRMLMVTDVQDVIKKHQSQIITSLKDPDIRLVFYHLGISLNGLWTRIFIFWCFNSKPSKADFNHEIGHSSEFEITQFRWHILNSKFKSESLQCSFGETCFLDLFYSKKRFLYMHLRWQFLAAGSVVFWRFLYIDGLDK